MSEHGGPYAKAEAEEIAEATGREYADAHGLPWPMPPTAVVGRPPRDFLTNPGLYVTRWLTGPEEARARGEFYLEVRPEMEALSEGATQRVNGRDVPVLRRGRELAGDVLPTRTEEVRTR